MSETIKQSQSAGDYSTNLQAQHVEIHHHHSGLTPAEVRQEFLDLFEANFYRLQSVARETAGTRAREITERFLAELSVRNPSGLQACQGPDMQAAIFTAQRDYARTGREDLEELLVDLLIQHSASADFLRIVLNEAISIAPKLTTGQLDTLTLILLFVHGAQIPTDFKTWEDVTQCLHTYVAPFIDPILGSSATFAHLKYTGCISLDRSGLVFLPLVREAFKNLAGLMPSSIADSSAGDLFLGLCAAEPQLRILENIYRHGDSPLDAAQLTPVGIALANANIRRKTGKEFDLAIWIK